MGITVSFGWAMNDDQNAIQKFSDLAVLEQVPEKKVCFFGIITVCRLNSWTRDKIGDWEPKKFNPRKRVKGRRKATKNLQKPFPRGNEPA